MQLALQDIGQLTDIGLDAAFAPVEGVSHIIECRCPPSQGRVLNAKT
jgi:hypothetical protein